MNEPTPAAEATEPAAPAEIPAPEVPLFQTPGAEAPEADTAADDDFTNPPILRDIRPSFWDFRDKNNDSTL